MINICILTYILNIGEDVMKKVEPVRDKEKIAEVERLLRQNNSSAIYGDLWVFLNQTAARIGDAVRLRYTDFNHIEGTC